MSWYVHTEGPADTKTEIEGVEEEVSKKGKKKQKKTAYGTRCTILVRKVSLVGAVHCLWCWNLHGQ